jgi:hypothetical protein
MLISFAAAFAYSAFADDYFESAPINYSKSIADNAVTRLQAEIDGGRVVLEADPASGYLKGLLDYLAIPVESQVLVFSKTSLQADYISPATPRAVYFNDDIYVGTVPSSDLIEISTADPGLGAVFYSLAPDEAARPNLIRENHRCLQCHATTMTRGIPGHLVRSVFTDANGHPIFKAGSKLTTHASPLEERWGGWYVTGTHGDMRHMGNEIAVRSEYGAELDQEAGANRISLDDRVALKHYLTPHSDIVALMVLEHQVEVHNLLTEADYAAQRALQDQAVLDEMLEEHDEALSESTRRRIANAGDKLVDAMLFVDEMRLTAPIKGTSGFTAVFSGRGPHDREGRSLRQFDLEARMFEYPLSYLIYSPQFEGLPAPMKDYVYQRLWDILARNVYSAKYQHLTNAKCWAIRQILADTKADLPAYWHGRRSTS